MDQLKVIGRVHYVFIADEEGIIRLFPVLKSILGEEKGHHVSLLYYSRKDVFVFRRELEVLNKHFYREFLVRYEAGHEEIIPAVKLETLESILNSNTMPEMFFRIEGEEEFVAGAEQQLYFLDIPKKNIEKNKQ